MKLALAQINTAVGDIQGNTEKILSVSQAAFEQNYQLVVFPEMALPGYPAEDLLLKPSFVQANLDALHALAKKINNGAIVVGFIDRTATGLTNAAAWIEKGRVQGVYHKHCLPNYGVFDEKRYFEPGLKPFVKNFYGLKVGVTICEDIWVGPSPLTSLKKQKPHLVVNLSASPFHAGKLPVRHGVAADSAQFLKAPLFYCNLVGGQDELVFDGGSFVVSAQGRFLFQGPVFEETLCGFDIGTGKKLTVMPLQKSHKSAPKINDIHRALVLGLRDYVDKNNFGHVALGISGGIDSALVAALAVEACGKKRVIGVTMPSQFNSSATISDSHRLAKNLGIRLIELPIQSLFQGFLKNLNPLFENSPAGLAEENIQARIRGTLLMTLSNKFNWLILTTGNKSEFSTGYCTLYGDTAGGFALIKDVLKTTVYDLSNHINQRAGLEIIPQTIIDRAPSAELRANQKDEDSLGAYAKLDPILIDYIENNVPVKELLKRHSSSKDYIQRIVGLVDRSEYKRRQAPPGIKITPRSFGRDRRMPITNRFKETF